MTIQYPTILARTKSMLIDSLIVIAGVYLISDIYSSFGNVPDSVKMGIVALMLLYEPICTTFGGTLGNNKMKIRVRRNSDPTKHINIFQALIRYIFKILLGWISFLAIFVNPKSRTIHDYISGSVMIEVGE